MENPKLNKNLLLLPWLEDHLERETFEGLRWSDRENRIFYVYWMHKAADPWTRKQVEVCEAWAKYKGNTKENPRDIKANFRCALRSKKELKLVHKAKDRLFWKIIDTGTEVDENSGLSYDKNNSKRGVSTSSSSSDENIAGPSTSNEGSCCSKKRKYTKTLSKPKQSRRGRKKSITKDHILSSSEISGGMITLQANVRTDHDSSGSSSKMSSGILSPFQAMPLIPEIQHMSNFSAMLPRTDIQPASPFQGGSPVTDVQRMSPAQVIPSVVDSHRTSPFQAIPIIHEQQASPFLDEQHIMSPQRMSPPPEVTMMDFQSPNPMSEITSTINLEQLSSITSSSYPFVGEQRPDKPLPSFTTFCQQNRLTPPKQLTDISAYGEALTFPLQEETYSWKSTTDASHYSQKLLSANTQYMSNSTSANEEQLVPSTSPLNLNLYFDNNNFHSPTKNFQENQLYSPMYEPHFEALNSSPIPSQDSQYVENSDTVLEEFYNFASLFTPISEYAD